MPFKRVIALLLVFSLIGEMSLPAGAATYQFSGTAPAARSASALYQTQAIVPAMVLMVPLGLGMVQHHPVLLENIHILSTATNRKKKESSPAASKSDSPEQTLKELIPVLQQLGVDSAHLLATERATAVAEMKATNSPMTTSDLKVQRMGFERILSDPRFAHVFIDAEEDLVKAEVAPELIQKNKNNFGKAAIVISEDPLDGTNVYVKEGKQDYCFAVGVVVNGRAAYALIRAPETGEVFEANGLTGVVTFNGQALHPDWVARHSPARIIGKGTVSQGIPHPLKDILPQHFDVTTKADVVILKTVRIALRLTEGFDAISSATNPAHDSVPAAAFMAIAGGKVSRPDGTPFFGDRVRWDDFSAEGRLRVPFIAGCPDVVDRIVALHLANPSSLEKPHPSALPSDLAAPGTAETENGRIGESAIQPSDVAPILPITVSPIQLPASAAPRRESAARARHLAMMKDAKQRMVQGDYYGAFSELSRQGTLISEKNLVAVRSEGRSIVLLGFNKSGKAAMANLLMEKDPRITLDAHWFGFLWMPDDGGIYAAGYPQHDREPLSYWKVKTIPGHPNIYTLDDAPTYTNFFTSGEPVAVDAMIWFNPMFKDLTLREAAEKNGIPILEGAICRHGWYESPEIFQNKAMDFWAKIQQALAPTALDAAALDTAETESGRTGDTATNGQAVAPIPPITVSPSQPSAPAAAPTHSNEPLAIASKSWYGQLFKDLQAGGKGVRSGQYRNRFVEAKLYKINLLKLSKMGQGATVYAQQLARIIALDVAPLEETLKYFKKAFLEDLGIGNEWIHKDLWRSFEEKRDYFNNTDHWVNTVSELFGGLSTPDAMAERLILRWVEKMLDDHEGLNETRRAYLREAILETVQPLKELLIDLFTPDQHIASFAQRFYQVIEHIRMAHRQYNLDVLDGKRPGAPLMMVESNDPRASPAAPDNYSADFLATLSTRMSTMSQTLRAAIVNKFGSKMQTSRGEPSKSHAFTQIIDHTIPGARLRLEMAAKEGEFTLNRVEELKQARLRFAGFVNYFGLLLDPGLKEINYEKTGKHGGKWIAVFGSHLKRREFDQLDLPGLDGNSNYALKLLIQSGELKETMQVLTPAVVEARQLLAELDAYIANQGRQLPSAAAPRNPFMGPGGDWVLAAQEDKLAMARLLIAENEINRAKKLLNEIDEACVEALKSLTEGMDTWPLAHALRESAARLLAQLNASPGVVATPESAVDFVNALLRKYPKYLNHITGTADQIKDEKATDTSPEVAFLWFMLHLSDRESPGSPAMGWLHEDRFLEKYRAPERHPMRNQVADYLRDLRVMKGSDQKRYLVSRLLNVRLAMGKFDGAQFEPLQSTDEQYRAQLSVLWRKANPQIILLTPSEREQRDTIQRELDREFGTQVQPAPTPDPLFVSIRQDVESLLLENNIWCPEDSKLPRLLDNPQRAKAFFLLWDLMEKSPDLFLQTLKNLPIIKKDVIDHVHTMPPTPSLNATSNLDEGIETLLSFLEGKRTDLIAMLQDMALLSPEEQHQFRDQLRVIQERRNRKVYWALIHALPYVKSILVYRGLQKKIELGEDRIFLEDPVHFAVDRADAARYAKGPTGQFFQVEAPLEHIMDFDLETLGAGDDTPEPEVVLAEGTYRRWNMIPPPAGLIRWSQAGLFYMLGQVFSRLGFSKRGEMIMKFAALSIAPYDEVIHWMPLIQDLPIVLNEVMDPSNGILESTQAHILRLVMPKIHDYALAFAHAHGSKALVNRRWVPIHQRQANGKTPFEQLVTFYENVAIQLVMKWSESIEDGIMAEEQELIALCEQLHVAHNQKYLNNNKGVPMAMASKQNPAAPAKESPQESKSEPGGRWKSFQPLYDAIGPGWIGQSLMPALLETGLVVGGICYLFTSIFMVHHSAIFNVVFMAFLKNLQFMWYIGHAVGHKGFKQQMNALLDRSRMAYSIVTAILIEHHPIWMTPGVMITMLVILHLLLNLMSQWKEKWDSVYSLYTTTYGVAIIANLFMGYLIGEQIMGIFPHRIFILDFVPQHGLLHYGMMMGLGWGVWFAISNAIGFSYLAIQNLIRIKDYKEGEDILRKSRLSQISPRTIAAWIQTHSLQGSYDILWNLFRDAHLLSTTEYPGNERFKHTLVYLWDKVFPDASLLFSSSPYQTDKMTSQVVRVNGRTFHILGIVHGADFFPMSVKAVYDSVKAVYSQKIPLYSEQNLKHLYDFHYGVEVRDHERIPFTRMLWVMPLDILFMPHMMILAILKWMKPASYGLPRFDKDKERRVDLRRSQMIADAAYGDNSGSADVVILVGAAHVLDIAADLLKKGEIDLSAASKGKGQGVRSFVLLLVGSLLSLQLSQAHTHSASLRAAA